MCAFEKEAETVKDKYIYIYNNNMGIFDLKAHKEVGHRR